MRKRIQGTLLVAVAIAQVTGAEQRMSAEASLLLIVRKCLLKSNPQPLDSRKSSNTILCMSYTVALNITPKLKEKISIAVHLIWNFCGQFLYPDLELQEQL